MDAGRISEDTRGKNFPNTPKLGAEVKVTGVIPEENFVKDMRQSFAHKFATKPQMIEGNMRALVKAMQEVLIG